MAVTLQELLNKSEQALQGVSPPSTEPPEVSAPIPPVVTTPAPTERPKPKVSDLIAQSEQTLSRELPKPDSMKLTLQDVINDEERLGKIRNYMVTSSDAYYETAPAEEVMQDFMSNMRFVNTNEMYTGKEFYKVMAADEDQRAIYGEAYKIYDEMGSMFSNGDGWNGLVDYAQAAVTSPSLVLGLGIGRIAGQAGTRAARAKAMDMAIDATTKAVVNKGAKQASSTAIREQIKTEAAKVTARGAIIGAVGVEAPFAGVADWMYQRTRTETGVQDEYSFLQGALSTTLGALSAAPAVGVLMRSRNTTLGQAGQLIDTANRERAKTAAKRAAPRIKNSLEKAQIDWLKLAEAGKGMDNDFALGAAIRDWMFDYNNPESLGRILMDEGAEFNTGGGNLTGDMIAYATNMGDEALEEFNEALKPLGITFGRATELAAASARTAGQVQNPASQFSRFYNNFKNTAVADRHARKTIVDDLLKEADDLSPTEATSKDYLGYATSSWKGLITATPMTTMLNLKGWAVANRTEALADVIVAGGILGKAGVKAIVGKGSLKDLARVKAITQNQVYTLNTLLDPFTSAEAFFKLLDKTAPKSTQKKITGQLFGGIDTFGPERFGLDPKKLGVRAVEKYTEAAQGLSLMRLQDSLTKGITGLQQLDKQSRLNFGVGIEDLIRTGQTNKITDEMWENVFDRISKETFSEDFSRGEFALRPLAKAVQDISNAPGFGFLLPFGRFMNGVMAYSYRYSLLGMMSVGSRVFYRGKGFDEEAAQMMARSLAGTGLMAYMAMQAASDQEEGLQWFERRTATGDVEDITNLFPLNVFQLSGRIIHNAIAGEGGSTELFNALADQMGSFDLLEDFASMQWLKPIVEYLTDESVTVEDRSVVMDGVKLFFEVVGGTAAGYTRPLDPINRGLSYTRPKMGGGIVVDRKQARGFEKAALEATRYVSGFFNYAFGEENEYGVRMVGRPRESASVMGPVRDPNPATFIAGGTRIDTPRTKINKLLGMVDMPPFRADSFTSGNPEYDAMMNKYITSSLEVAAERLMNSEYFKNAPQSLKIDEVNKLINQVQTEILSAIDGRVIGDDESTLLNERRKLLTRDRSQRIRARKALGITTPDHKLSMYEIEAIQLYMKVEEEELKRQRP